MGIIFVHICKKGFVYEKRYRPLPYFGRIISLRRVAASAILSIAALTLAPAANAQIVYYDTDGATIGNIFPGSPYIGFNTMSPLTVYADAGTNALTAKLYNNATLDMSGGDIFGLYAGDNSALNMSGGTVPFGISAFGNAALTVTGGTIGSLGVSSNATAALSNVTIPSYFQGLDNAAVSVSSGSYGEAQFIGASVLNITGGTFTGYVRAQENATVNIYGGQFPMDINIPITAEDAYFGGVGGTVNLYGSGLTATLIDPNLFGIYTEYLLSGVLQDGSSVAGVYLATENGTGASYNLINTPVAAVPEPGAFAFGVLAIGSVLGLIARKRKR